MREQFFQSDIIETEIFRALGRFPPDGQVKVAVRSAVLVTLGVEQFSLPQPEFFISVFTMLSNGTFVSGSKCGMAIVPKLLIPPPQLTV